MSASILLGYEVGTGTQVSVPARHMAVTGQTQESGKTTTLEALARRAGGSSLAFITKRGEASFAEGRRVRPYFRDRADWQFVTSIIDATLQEKNKFLRPWIMKICRNTTTLAEVQDAVREALATAKGIHEGVYTQLSAYLDLIVPEIQRADLAAGLELGGGINVMDVSSFPLPMQMLFVQSALDWVNERCSHTTVIIPEAWEFIPEGKGSPVKASAIALARKGAALGNFIWVDSQDMAGVDKTILRGCAVWLIGKQREANEVKRNLANIPAGIRRPKAEDLMRLERGEFFACFGHSVVKAYVQPSWMPPGEAIAVAKGTSHVLSRPPKHPPKDPPKEEKVNKAEAQALRAENTRLQSSVDALKEEIRQLREQQPVRDKRADAPATTAPAPATAASAAMPADMDALYAEFRRRAIADPVVLKVLAEKPVLEVTIEHKVVTIDGQSLKGRIARLIASGFYDEGVTQGGTRSELARTGPDVNSGNLSRAMTELQRDGFLTFESGNKYRAVADMKVNVRRAA